MTPEQVARFWAKVDKSGECWLWTASCTPLGYGRCYTPGAGGYAHRASYLIHYGAIPAGLEVMHECDTPNCVRPDHLKVGTHQDNMDDKVRKGRQQRGERCSKAKLTTSQAQEIKQRLAKGERGSQLAREYNVTKQTICGIRHNRSWAYL
jgi:hypothetical protein